MRNLSNDNSGGCSTGLVEARSSFTQTHNVNRYK